MKILEIHGQSGDSKIFIDESLKNLPQYIKGKRAVIVTDKNVAQHYQALFPDCDVIRIPPGEEAKNLSTVESIYDRLLELELDRSGFIVGIGGGIVCDVTGFAASTYMRGLPFGFVSSTLLSQVDASIGGKNGVNFHGYKNIIGVFNQPSFVICDLEMLKTLSKKDILCGLAEIVKHAVIGNKELFHFLEKNFTDALNLDRQVIEKLVYDSIIIKSAIVEKDEKEKGERRKLNFGHTLGHALEKTIGIPHGEAVSIGMVAAANLSVRKKLLSREDADRLKLLLKKINLPTEITAGVDREKIFVAMGKDKKRQGQGIHFVLLKDIGEAVVEEIPLQQLMEVIN